MNIGSRMCSGYRRTRAARRKRLKSMVIPSYRFILFTSSPAATTSSSSFTCSPLPIAEWITKVPVRFYVATRTMRFHYVSRPSLRRVETLLIHGVPPRITFQRVDSARYLQPIFLRRKFSKETICRNLLSFSFFFYAFSFSTFFVFFYFLLVLCLERTATL